MDVYKYGRDEMLMFVLNSLRHNAAAATTLIIFLKQSAAKREKQVGHDSLQYTLSEAVLWIKWKC